ncbi:hypothetical protein Malapachy_1461 [Malassezia pachydermatis]|uniref:Uncharacterized protein n=1 Tax=Malassezia pachydermatis TaxID=77020 RepID=A0A0M8MKA0_9BASI|nr:hypothetical protein Malapachy_1461 [Malassezia pachydermatis]KOS13258.1 hypothetical protein Malapachy_1461 [Malassezia pachydermatis]
MLSQQFGVMHWYLPRTLIGAVLVYCWIASDGQGSYVAIIVLYGFFTSNVLSSMPKIVSDLTDNPADVSVFCLDPLSLALFWSLSHRTFCMRKSLWDRS